MEKNEQRKLRHLDLFSGIGGFSLGLESTGGFETVGFCDNEPFAQKVLKKHWPDVPIYEDVRSVGVETIGYRGVDIITGGFPCQSVSVAGLQKATEDDRWLWPEMFRIIKEIRPTYVLGENVRNLVSIRDGVVFEQVCVDLESEGYETKSLILPASSQNAPHLRYRCWIIAVLGNSKHDGQSAKSQLRSDDETSNEWGKEKQKATREFERASRSSDGAGISGSECKSEQSAVQKENRTKSDVANTKSERSFSTSKRGKRNKDKSGIHNDKEEVRGEVRSKSARCSELREQDVADTDGKRSGRIGNFNKTERDRESITTQSYCGSGNVADTDHEGSQGRLPGGQSKEWQGQLGYSGRSSSAHRQPEKDFWTVEPNVGRTRDGVSKRIHGHWGDNWEEGTPRVAEGQKNRTQRLKALGNSVIPQIPAVLGRAILEVHWGSEQRIKK